jgi:branched-chain amino acid transport system substrate-binding protein
MKKLWIGISIVVVVALAIVLIVTQTKKEPKEIKIGAILPLTGSAGYIGEALKMGMELALDEMNKREKMDGVVLKLIFEESMNDPKTGVSAYRKLITDEEVEIVISAMSTVTKSIIPLVDKDEIPLLATVVSTEGIAGQNPWVFRFFTRADVDAKAMAEYAYQTLKLRKVAILHVQDDFGVSYAQVFSKIFEKLGGKITIAENFFPGETNFSSIIAKIKSSAVDGIYILSYANNLALIPKQMKELGIRTTILSIGTISQRFVVEQAGGSVEGAYYTTNAFNTFRPTTEEMTNFVKNFEKKYGKTPEYFEVFGYDAINLIAEAIKIGGITKKGIQTGLLSIHDYRGAAGKISVSERGEVNFPVIIARVAEGRPSSPLMTTEPGEYLEGGDK